MKIIISALDIIEKQAHILKEDLKAGKKASWDHIKSLLIALGILAGEPEIQAEAGKKNPVYPGLLSFFSFSIKRWLK